MKENTMPTRSEVTEILEHARTYFTQTLLPFWVEQSPDQRHGGFLTYFDRNGKPTGETDKTFLMQIRMLFTMASAHRAGYGDGRCAELASMGARFITDHYWDDLHGGWYWIADRDGNPTVTSKVGYGQCFGIYAFSEYFLATGDPLGKEAAERTYRSVCEHMVDTQHGGFIELMQRDWQPDPPGRSGGDRKSLDIHMHMMEALTTFYEMTRHPTHRRRLLETIDLLLAKMLRPGSGTGYYQFTYDFRPLPAIIFSTSWGRDAPPEGGQAHPIDYTSYGHNVEFAWLLQHASQILGVDRTRYAAVVRNMCDHCLRFGIDPEYGGVYCEGPDQSLTSRTEKQFWQQGEVLIGMLDAYLLFGEERYWKGFRAVWDFLFRHMVNMEGGGEWYERVDRQGTVVDGALAHGWKISYHSVRSMIQVIRRLEQMQAPASSSSVRHQGGGFA
jgi:mannose/cellobiose epimerase-like protein (N-acyl-D-glucosamine 2-epimerase family)